MQITATRIMVRWRVLLWAICVLSASASTSTAQLRFAGPSNQPPVDVEADTASRTNKAIRQAQFQPIPPTDDFAPAPPRDLPSPAPANAAAATPGANQGAAVGPPAEVIGNYASQDTFAPAAIPSDEGVWQENWEGPFDPQMVEQDQAILYSTGSSFRRGYWYSQVDFVALLRTEMQEVYISADNSAAGLGSIDDLNAPLLSTKNVNPTYTGGTRLTLGRFLGQDVTNRDYIVDCTFLGLLDYSERSTLIALFPNGILDALGPGNHYFTNGITGSVIGAATPGFGDARQHDIQYDSDLNSLEVNLRILDRPVRDRLALQPNGSWIRNGTASHLKSLLIGMRAMSINEMFDLKASFQDPTTSGHYQVRTSNDMFGIQLGGELVENYSGWSWGARFKAGGLFNFADRRSAIDVMVSGDQQTPRDQFITSENLAAVLEGGLMASYQIRTNLVARVAYDAMYVQGIATATENLSLADAFPDFEVTGDAIFHGLSVGLEMLW